MYATAYVECRMDRIACHSASDIWHYNKMPTEHWLRGPRATEGEGKLNDKFKTPARVWITLPTLAKAVQTSNSACTRLIPDRKTPGR